MLFKAKLSPEQKEGLEYTKNRGRVARTAWDTYMK